jgi:RNA polymerase sigma-70 factor (ECF subfamily)
MERPEQIVGQVISSSSDIIDTRAMQDVIARASAGDAEALTELWRAHQHLLLRYFRGKGMTEPEDLASIVWLEVARGLSTFSGDRDDFRRWLFTIATRRRIDEIRRDRRRRELDDAVLAATERPVTPGADEDADRAAALERALTMIKRLPADQAEAVLLRVVADLSVADTATIMGHTDGNVRVLVHRGLKRLALELGRVDSGSAPCPTAPATAVTKAPERSMYVS